MSQPATISPEHYQVDTDAPVSNFSHCHIGISHEFCRLLELCDLPYNSPLTQQIASRSVKFFHHGLRVHHQDEEQELFPAVQFSAQKGEERAQVDQLIEALTTEHRELEQLWEDLEPALKKIANGQKAQLDTGNLKRLMVRCSVHAESEELKFLPLCEKILGRNSNHMAALGLSLHMRHSSGFLSYI